MTLINFFIQATINFFLAYDLGTIMGCALELIYMLGH